MKTNLPNLDSMVTQHRWCASIVGTVAFSIGIHIGIFTAENAVAENQAPIIAWEEMERLEPAELWSECNTMNLYERLDLAKLSSEQIASLKVRLKKIGPLPGVSQSVVPVREFTMLVKLHDEETANFLLSRLELGGGWARRAGGVLRESGQSWLLPRLERTVFWDPSAEPEIHSECVMFASVSDNAFGICWEIVRRSPDFAPKFKEWFEILAEIDPLGTEGQRREILTRWWSDNRDRLAAGHYQDLSMIALWPGQPTEVKNTNDPFSRSDFLAALKSEFLNVRRAALQKIEKEWVNNLTEAEVREIAKVLPKPGDFARQLAANLLAKKGGEGIDLLKKATDDPDDEVRACAAMALLDFSEPGREERNRYFNAIVGGLGYTSKASFGCVSSNYLNQHPQLRLVMMPLLKARIVDKALPDTARTAAAYHFGNWATDRDMPFLEELLSTDFPKSVRGWTIHALCRISPRGNPPDSIKKLASDPELGPLIQENHYLEKPRE